MLEWLFLVGAEKRGGEICRNVKRQELIKQPWESEQEKYKRDSCWKCVVNIWRKSDSLVV
jgi:hypothetical protein